MSDLEQPAESAVRGGQVWFGRFERPFLNLNLLDAECGIPRLLGWRSFRLKEWVHIAVVHQEWYFSLALVDLGLLVTSWLHVFDRQTGAAFEHERKLPLRSFCAPANLWNHVGRIQSRGYRVSVHHHLERQVHGFKIEVNQKGPLPGVSGSLVLHEDPARTQPLVALLPLGPNRPMFTHKSACPVSGELAIGGEKVWLAPDRDVALLDYHKAFYPHHTFWRWATFGSIDSNGEILGVNLTHNVIEDDARYNENCIWHGNRVSPVGPARFSIPEDRRKPWRIRTLDGRVELELVPQGLRRERVSFGLLGSSYDQPYGLYWGTLTDSEGVRHEVDRVFGLAEDHVAIW